MADAALGITTRIIKVAFEIKGAMEAVRQNGEECLEAQEWLATLVAILSRLEATKKHPAMDMAVMSIEQDMNRLLSDVTSWQKRRRFVGRCITARAMNRKLRRAQDSVHRKLSSCSLAILVDIHVQQSPVAHNPLTQPLQFKIVIKVEMVGCRIGMIPFAMIRGVLSTGIDAERHVLELVCNSDVDPIDVVALLRKMKVPSDLTGVAALSAEEAYRGVATHSAAPEWHGASTGEGEAGPSRTSRIAHWPCRRSSRRRTSPASDCEESQSPESSDSEERSPSPHARPKRTRAKGSRSWTFSDTESAEATCPCTAAGWWISES